MGPVRGCKSCGAPILWVTTTNGKRMPVDAKPEKRVVLDQMPEPRATVIDTYVPHFVTCPNADKHRRTRS